MSFLVDTDVLSEARKENGDNRVKAWIASAASIDLHVSVLTVGEIRQGIERLRRRDGPQAAVYERWLERLLRDYSDRIIPISAEIAEEWGRMNAGSPLPAIDSLLAATAKLLDLTLVTRNVRDMARTGARLLDPFEDTA